MAMPEKPSPRGRRQMTRGPSGGQALSSPFSSETPSLAGPRNCGQSPPAAPGPPMPTAMSVPSTSDARHLSMTSHSAGAGRRAPGPKGQMVLVLDEDPLRGGGRMGPRRALGDGVPGQGGELVGPGAGHDQLGPVGQHQHEIAG